jgi:hypothetical protein
MKTVKVLVDAVGPWNKGDIVQDAPPGLIEMAEKGTVNIATGERVAELVEDEDGDDKVLKQLKAHAKETGVKGYGKMNAAELIAAIEKAEKEVAHTAELKELQTKAAELQIADSEKLSRDELIGAIEAAGGGKGAE